VAEGQHLGNVTTVNGSVTVGANAVVGSAHTVNGPVRLEHGAAAASIATVNGAIQLGEHSHITGAVHAVNGAMEVADGATVNGELGNVNGEIRVRGAHIGGPVKTASGDILAGPGAHIDGGIIVERPHGRDFSGHVPRIVIGPGAVVNGPMHFEREVNLYVSDHATIGTIEGATPQRFSGDAPPP
jgi:cytoskeletal protein CcmA (bactofilin family)